jgi:hypothetical protein
LFIQGDPEERREKMQNVSEIREEAAREASRDLGRETVESSSLEGEGKR